MDRVIVERMGQRKTRKGWLGNFVRQTYSRDDIGCGIQQCPEHRNSSHFQLSPDAILQLYLIDEDTLVNQADIIENCEQLQNLIILQSLVEQLKIRKPSIYNHFKHFLESTSRHVYVLPNQYHAGCRVALQEANRNSKAVIKSAKWYVDHIVQNNLKANVTIITSDYTIHKLSNAQKIQCLSLIDFLKQNNSNMLDYVGFGECKAQTFSKIVFAQHIPQEILVQTVKKGQYLQGKYMDNRTYIKVGKDMINCMVDNNRAMYGDTIAVMLYPDNKWKKNNLFLVEEEENTEINQLIEVDEQPKELLEKLKNTKLTPTGSIVGILKRQPRNYCGSIKEQTVQKLQSGEEIRQFVPVDTRFPTFYIKLTNPKQLQNKRIVVAFDEWPATSAKPLCHFKRIIGDVGDMRAEGDVILLQHNVEITPFSKSVYDCLPPDGDAFKISEEQIKKRLDLRNVDVVSIDPPGCKDIDDALHCFPLPNGNYSVGVHIADVSYFVRPDTAIDKEAAHRSTTVYLVDRRTDMLPKLLTENLCSLRANVQRLVFSTIWEMDINANILSTKYCKSVIRSRAAMTYGEAQSRIDDKNDNTQITKSIRILNILAKKLKQGRLDRGALQLASTQVKFSFDQQTHNPTDVQLYQLLDTNSLIEQFMLLSNIAVAQKICQRFPAVSILRHHVPPKYKQLEEFKRLLNTQGFDLQMATSKDLADSLDRLERPNDEFFNKLMRIMTTRCMNQATYFCTADYDLQQFYHYGLAAPLYTHFTSPIRRYADVLVHRLLAAAIDLEALPHNMSNKLKMTKICDKMNMRHRMARFASRASSDYHTYLFFKDRKIVEKAIITSIAQQGFNVMLPKYGLQSMVRFSEEDRRTNEQLNKEQPIVTTCRHQGKTHKIFDYIWVTVTVELKGFHKKIILEQTSQNS